MSETSIAKQRRLALVLVLVLPLIVEEVLGYLHPQLLPYLLVLWLVGVLHGHLDVVNLKCNLHGLVVVIQNSIDHDLGLFLHFNLLFQLLNVLLGGHNQWIVRPVVWIGQVLLLEVKSLSLLVKFLLVLLLILVADVEGVIDFQEDGHSFGLLALLILQV